MKKIFAFALALSLTSFGAQAHEHGQAAEATVVDTTIKTVPVAENIFMLAGEGGNIGVLRDDKKTIIVDSQFGHLTPKLKEAIAKISDKPIAFLLNTHFHFDHTDGNANFAKDGAYIIAQENVRSTLEKGAEIKAFGKVMEPAPKEALPVITFKNVLNVYADNEELHLQHYPTAHTNSDSVVFFKTPNVVHTGDLYFAGMYPFIDTSNGGTVAGYIAAMEAILARADENTKIIPGHGQLATKAQMEKDLAMLKDVAAIVTEAKEYGKTAAEIAKLDSIQKYDAEYGQGFLPTEKFIETIY